MKKKITTNKKVSVLLYVAEESIVLKAVEKLEATEMWYYRRMLIVYTALEENANSIYYIQY